MKPQSGSGARAIVVSPTAHTLIVSRSTGRIPQMPIQRLVSGPETAWPTLVAASTRPAAP